MYIILIAIALYTLWYYLKNDKLDKSMAQFPGPMRFPIVGNLFQMGNNPIENMKNFKKLWNKYGNNFRLYFGGSRAAVFLTDPKDLEILLTSTKWISKPRGYTFLGPWLGNGLVISTGDEWRHHRKIITPTFHFKILEQFLPIFHSQLDILIDKLSNKIKDGEAFDVNPYVTAFGLDVICETAMGQHVDAQNNTEGDYIKAVKAMCNVANRRIMNPFLNNATIFKYSKLYKQQNEAVKVLHAFVDKVIENRKEYLKTQIDIDDTDDVEDIGTKKRLAFLDLLLKSTDDQGNHLPYNIIRDEVHTFMFAGHDTTTLAISFACYLFSINPDIQDKVFQEQRDIMGSDLNRQPTHSEIQNMKYLDMALKEVMRLYPPAPLFSRLLTEDSDFRGKVIPAGCVIIIAPYIIHKNPDQFPDPEKFDPERFTPEQQSKRNPFAYIPFSAGPRNCIGQKFAHLELRAAVSRLIRHFEFIPSGEDRDIILSAEFTMRVWNGIHIKIKERIYN